MEGLRAKLATAEHGSAAQIADLTTKLDMEKGNSGAKTAEMTARLEAERRASAATVGDLTAKLAEVNRSSVAQVADLTAKLNAAEHGSAAQVADMIAQLGIAKRGSTAALTALTSQLEEAKRASAAQIADLTGKLESNKRDAGAQVADLTTRLAASEHGSAAQIADLTTRLVAEKRVSAVQVADLTGKLEAAQRSSATQVADLTDRFVATEHRAAARTEELRQQLETERAQSSVVVRNLPANDDKLTQAVRQQAIADGERRSHEAVAQDNGNAGGHEQSRVTPADKVDQKQVVAALSPKPPSAQVDRANGAHDASTEAPGPINPPSSILTNGVTGARPAVSDALESGGKTLNASAQSAVPSPAGVLPEDPPAHVILRYSHGSQAAKTRAIALRLTLQAQGIDVADPVDAPRGIAVNGVTYFYHEDESKANRVAGVLATYGPVRNHRNANEELPRPGTIEVAVAG